MMVLGIALSAALLAQAATQVATPNSPAASLQETAFAQADVRVAISQDDPAEMIRMGVALANSGQTDAALELLNAAARSETRYRLETADGGWVDSRRLALKVIAMIDDGAFAKQERIAAR